MSTFPFESFIELVRFDQAIKQRHRAIDKEQKALEQLQDQTKQFEQEFDTLKLTVHDAQKIVDATELDMKSLDEREADIKNKIERIENPKEYSGLKKELDAVHASQNELEDTLVGVWNQLETAKRSLMQKQDDMATKIKDAQQLFQAKQQEIEQLKKTVQDNQKTRPDKLKPIPEEWLDKYEMMYKRVDDPVVEVVQGGCGGCFYPIPNHELARLKRRALLQCNSCYRFVYDPELLPAEVSSDKSE